MQHSCEKGKSDVSYRTDHFLSEHSKGILYRFDSVGFFHSVLNYLTVKSSIYQSLCQYNVSSIAHIKGYSINKHIDMVY